MVPVPRAYLKGRTAAAGVFSEDTERDSSNDQIRAVAPRRLWQTTLTLGSRVTAGSARTYRLDLRCAEPRAGATMHP